MTTRKATIEVNDSGESIVTRVVSRDGTEIAYWTSGDGPPLILIHGAPADHTRWRPLLPYRNEGVLASALQALLRSYFCS